MTFTPVKNVRISSLTPGSEVQLRLGNAAVKSPDDVTVEAKLVRHEKDGEKSVAVLQETNSDGEASDLTISRYPRAPWMAGNKYISLLGVNESTYTLQKTASPVQTDAIAKAVTLIEQEAKDVWGAEQLIALLSLIQTGKRVNSEIKGLANQLANKLVEELSNLPAEVAA
jgi:hypothetical protein